MAERTTVRLPEELMRRAKPKAPDEGRSLTELIEEGLRRMVNEAPDRSDSARVPPRVRNATRGLMPGINLVDSAALQEANDLEYLKRQR